MSGGNSSGGTPIFMPPNEKPKDIFGAVSQLEIIYEAEKSGAEMPDKFATVKERLDYFNLGLRSMIGGTILSVLLAPISSAVIGNNFPIFGNFNPGVTDKIIAYVLSFGYSIAYMMLFVYAGRLRRGNMSSVISSNLLAGMTTGVVLKFLIAAFIYGFMYFIILTPERITAVFRILVKMGASEGVYNLLRFIVLSLKSSLIPSIYIFFYTSLAVALIPWGFAIYATIKNKPKEL